MSEQPRESAATIRDLAGELSAAGWDRRRGARLIDAVSAARDRAREDEWLEGVGRAESLVQILAEFMRETPSAGRLEPVLHSAEELASQMAGSHHGDQVDPGSLPADPGEWTFLLLGDELDPDAAVARSLRALGFSADHVARPDALAIPAAGRTIVLAGAAWLERHVDALAAVLAGCGRSESPSCMLVAVGDGGDVPPRFGASLQINGPLDVRRMLERLAGLAWVPRTPFRVVLVNDDAGARAAQAGVLREAGFEVMAVDDPCDAHELVRAFAPEACVVDLDRPDGRAVRSAAALRRDIGIRLPMICLSSMADIERQIEIRLAGGEDYLVKPVDGRLLAGMVLAQARRFRMLDAAYRQRRLAWRRMDNLRRGLDEHAIVSVTGADGSILYVNDKFRAVSGYSRAELIGRNHRIIKSGHHPAAFFEGLWKTISSGRAWHGEIKNRRKDGASYWVQSTIVPILDERGLPEQYVSVRTEITEQKRLQAERESQSRLLDAIRQSLQHFIVNRDLDSTSALLLDAMMLVTGSDGGFISEVQYDADGTPRLHTHALADRPRGEAGRAHGRVFRNLAALYGPAILGGEPLIINDPAADPRRGELRDGDAPLESFLGLPIRHGNCLVGVAGLANRPGGFNAATVELLAPLEATYASILEAARQRNLQQQAIDDLQRARDAAELADRQKAAFLASRGSEMRDALNAMLGHAQVLLLTEGLAPEAAEQAREIVKGGEQLAREIDRLGRKFVAGRSSPAATAAATPPSTGADAAGGRRRILVAEDNPANQVVLRMQLDVLGCDADIAVDGTAALVKWQGGGHDLILADRNMPGMDGLALARAIRASERESGNHVPIIAITAAHHREDLAACYDAGMDDVLAKPIELEEMRRLLAHWLPRALPASAVADAAAAVAGDALKAIDSDYLAHIVGSADPAQMRELVDLFTATAQSDLPACRGHLGERDGRNVALVMHKLKSSARMVGALRFATLAESVEEAARAGRMSEAAHGLAQLELALGDVETAAGTLAGATAPAVVAAASPSRSRPLPQRVLVVDDDPVSRRQLGMLLSGIGVGEVVMADGANNALVELRRPDERFDLLITDLNMPDVDGIEFLRQLADAGYSGCVVLCSGVKDRLLQAAADLTRSKGLRLYGTISKPATREALLQLLATPCEQARCLPAPSHETVVTSDDLMTGMRRDEFQVHFQPKVDARTLQVVGVEALARWQRADRTMIPAAFIEAAERDELIAPLSQVLITKALIGGARLAAAGHQLFVAVNISASWLADIRLPEFIEASVQATGFPAERLILEITETGVMADAGVSLDVLTRLRLKGFNLSIDDFGIGYSSMEQLQRIPFGELKIDRSFVRGAADDPAKRAILTSTLGMARKLKLSTVAEGVETEADLDLVRGLGCDLVQGWLICKALSTEALIHWMNSRNIYRSRK
jgi:PAS domain S-box-containing protein